MLTTIVACPDHKEPKGIVAIVVGQKVWQCFHEDCLCQQNARLHKIHVGQTVSTPREPGKFVVVSIDESYRATIELLQEPEDRAPLHWDKVSIDDLVPLEAAS